MSNDFKHELLKQRREHLQLSRLDLVKRLWDLKFDISEETIRMWEDGYTAPDADKLPVLADVLKVKVHEFYQ